MSQDSRIKIQDIAEKAQVSISTVSRVINKNPTVSKENRAAVEEAIAELGYRPNRFAQGLSSGQSHTIGVLTQNFGSPFYDSILRGILQGFEGTNYFPIFADGQWDQKTESDVLERFQDRQVDGVIIIGGVLQEKAVKKWSKPLLFVAQQLPNHLDRCVYVDNEMGGYNATKYLIDMGHRKIAHITSAQKSGDIYQRYLGYVRALKESGIPLDRELVIEGDLQHQSGMQAIEILLMKGKLFTAVFSANDQMAMGVQLGLFRRGWRVPQEVSVIGFDNLGSSSYTIPPLTSIHQPAEALGVHASTAILDQIKGNSPKSRCFSTELIIRESVQRK